MRRLLIAPLPIDDDGDGPVDHWWPEINAFVTTGITNARTEGYNRLLKQVKRGRMRIPESRQLGTPDTNPLHPQTAGRNPDFKLIARPKSKSQHG